MIINMSGGGIDNLKFRVYAATSLPASGKENDVCIITSTPISGWEVYPNSPAWESVNGHVYIQNDPAYSGEYPNVNILKKNAIWLYLIKCWQYENGTWSAKGAYQYRNGAWVQFSTVFRATINITYPAGSTCKATCGSTTLTAPNTSGIWACVVPNAGTWTVTATDGASTKAETVDITQEGQELSIELRYRFYLFMKGQGMQNGFNFEASLSSYTSADNNRITYNNNCQLWGAFQIKPNIDMSIYKSICFDVDVEATWQSGSYSLVYGVGAYVSSGFDYEHQGTWAAKATKTVAGNPDRVVYRVDLSGVESTQYVKFVSRGTQGYVYNIWLE